MAKLCLNFLDVNEKYCDDYGRAMTPLLIAATLGNCLQVFIFHYVIIIINGAFAKCNVDWYIL